MLHHSLLQKKAAKHEAYLSLNFKFQIWILHFLFWCNISFTIILQFAVIQIGPLSIDTLTVFLGSFEILYHNIIVWAAEDSILQKSAFFPCRKLAFTRGAGETSQVEGATSCPTHPVTRMDVTPTTGTASPIPPGIKEKNKRKKIRRELTNYWNWKISIYLWKTFVRFSVHPWYPFFFF